MEKKLISVIIPAYNTEAYLDKCIKSVIEQTYKNLEIILVDDGSTDNTRQIMGKWSKTDERIKTIYKEHDDAFNSRKVGVNQATGEYIGFVDSDDYIDIDYFERLATHIDKCDITLCGIRVVEENEKKKKEKNEKFNCEGMRTGFYSTEREINYILSNMMETLNYHPRGNAFISASLCSKLFRTQKMKEIYENINFSGNFAEDAVVSYKYIIDSKQIYIEDYCGYNYVKREGSNSNSENLDYLLDVNEQFKYFSKIYVAHPLRQALMKQLESYISAFLLSAGKYLGFSEERRLKQKIFPYIYALKDKRIALYGAGEVGRSYYYQLKRREDNHMKICELEVWVSKNWRKRRKDDLPLRPVDDLLTTTYDYVVVAVEREDMAEEIKKELICLGVDRDKLLWREPIDLLSL